MTLVSLQALAPLVAVLVLVELVAGTQVATWVGDVVAGVGRGFVGTTSVIALVVLSPALALLPFLPDPSQLVGHAVDAGRYAAFVHWTVGLAGGTAAYAFFAAVGTDAARRVVGGVAAGCGLLAVGWAAASFGSPLLGGWAGAVTLVPAALLSGSTLAGMLLGHWYLIAPDLSFRPLRLAVGLVGITLALQAAAVGIGVAGADATTRATLLGGGYGLTFWILVVAAGLLVAAAVVALAGYYARTRANQPATAMLYILVVAVLMGVVPGHLLYFLTRVPL